MDSVRGDLKSLESFSIQDISGIVLVDDDLGHHEVCNDDGDNHWVILVNGVDTLEVPIRESDKRETSLRWCIEKIDVDVPNGVKIVLSGLAGLFSLGKSAHNGVDYTSDLLGGFLPVLMEVVSHTAVAGVCVFLSLLLFYLFFLLHDSYVAPLGVLQVSFLLGGCPTF